MGKVVKIFGYCWGERRLAWIGFEDRLDYYFVSVGHGRFYRVNGPPTEGWGKNYERG